MVFLALMASLGVSAPPRGAGEGDYSALLITVATPVEVVTPCRLFRAHVGGGANDGSGSSERKIRGTPGHDFADPEVEDLSHERTR